MNILVLNPGSSSFKYALYSMTGNEGSFRETQVAKGTLEHSIENSIKECRSTCRSTSEAVEKVLSLISKDGLPEMKIEAIGCRVVHGGSEFIEPTLITDEVLPRLLALNDLAPLHNPIALETINLIRVLLPDIPCIAVFDTAFHQTIPLEAATYGLPHELCEKEGLRRYGFHGISYRHVSELLLKQFGRNPDENRMIVCHLGSGASVCAIKDGKSVDTSMGFTPTEGLLMGTRCGDIDPGLILHLMRTNYLSAERLEETLNHKSGLLGVSGISADVRDLEAAALTGNIRAEEALALFAYRVMKYIGSYSVVLDGLQDLVFTGGIGEHSAMMRDRICRRLKSIGCFLDPLKNSQLATVQPLQISSEESRVRIWIVQTDEELQIAREAGRCVSE